MTLYNVRADFEPDDRTLALDDALDALQDLHVSILEEADGRRSYTLTLGTVSATEAHEVAARRLAEVGAWPSHLVRLEVITTVEFDAREEAV